MYANSANAQPTVAEAEEVAAKALLFLVSDEERFDSVAAATGLSPDDLRAGVLAPMLQAALFDHLMSHEPWVMQFAAEHEIKPERFQPIAEILSDLAAGRTPRLAGPSKSSKRFQPLYPLRRT
jgi:hypothetical protein